MIRRPPRFTQGVSSAASDVYKRQFACCPSGSFCPSRPHSGQEGLFPGIHTILDHTHIPSGRRLSSLPHICNRPPMSLSPPADELFTARRRAFHFVVSFLCNDLLERSRVALSPSPMRLAAALIYLSSVAHVAAIGQWRVLTVWAGCDLDLSPVSWARRRDGS